MEKNFHTEWAWGPPALGPRCEARKSSKSGHQQHGSRRKPPGLFPPSHRLGSYNPTKDALLTHKHGLKNETQIFAAFTKPISAAKTNIDSKWGGGRWYPKQMASRESRWSHSFLILTRRYVFFIDWRERRRGGRKRERERQQHERETWTGCILHAPQPEIEPTI